MTIFLEHWASQSEENAKLAAQELLIAEVTEAIWEAMQAAGITKTELANRLGSTKGYVSQVLNGSRNMTLRTLSDFCCVLNQKPTISVYPKGDGGAWQTLTAKDISAGPSKLHYRRTGNLIEPLDHWPLAA
ncbi:hypothetical protein THIOKS12330009 [Thiocapsa sp. KS1]|nr:helix-turn-helix transcriptional regulator [Thiocapsa sp. KS1]CRI65313.1 hypothetical protein THIOKS12330009 [Thiocapsa sp. KS1]